MGAEEDRQFPKNLAAFLRTSAARRRLDGHTCESPFPKCPAVSESLLVFGGTVEYNFSGGNHPLSLSYLLLCPRPNHGAGEEAMRIVQIVAARVIADQIDRVVAAAAVVVAHALTERRCYRHLGQPQSGGCKPTGLHMQMWPAPVWCGPSGLNPLRSEISGGF